MARLLADENFPRPVVVALRHLGHDVVDLEMLGVADQSLPDADVLKIAIREGRAVLTLNRRDFVRLHQAQPIHSGIVVCTLDLDFTSLAARINAALSTTESMDNRIIRVVRPGPMQPGANSV